MNREEIRKLYNEISETENIIEFDRDDVINLTKEDLEERRELVLDLIRKARRVGHPQNHILSAIGQTVHTPYVSSYALKSFTMYQEAIIKTEEKTAELCEVLDIEYPLTLSEFSRLYALCEAAYEGKNLPIIWLLSDRFFEFTESLGEFLALRNDSINLEEEIYENWVSDIENIDADGILASWKEIEEKSPMVKKVMLAVLLKKLSPYTKTVVETNNAYETLHKVSKLQKNQAAILKIKEEYGELLPSSLRLSRSDVEIFTQCYETAKNICENLVEKKAEDYLSLLTRDNIALLQSGHAVWKRFCEVRNGIHKALMVDPSRILFVKDFLTTEMNFCEVCKRSLDMFYNWIEWNAAKKKAMQNGLSKVCKAYDNGMIHSVVLDAYEKGLYKALYEIYG